MNGVVRYSTYRVRIHFPKGQEVCRYCPLLRVEGYEKRAQCQRTGEYLPEPDHERGIWCPLSKEENDEESGDI